MQIRSESIGLVQEYPEEGEEFPGFDVGEKGRTWSSRVLTKILNNTEEVDFPRDIYELQLYRVQLWNPV